MSFPQGPIISGGRSGTAIYSTNIRESNPNEFTATLPTANGDALYFYRFAPKFTGEYNISLEIKSGGGTMLATSSSPTRTQNTTNNTVSDTLVSSAILNSSIPIGSIIVGIGNGSSATLAAQTLGTTSSATYVTISRVLVVHDLVPIFLYATNGTTNGIVFIKNVSISYDVVR